MLAAATTSKIKTKCIASALVTSKTSAYISHSMGRKGLGFHRRMNFHRAASFPADVGKSNKNAAAGTTRTGRRSSLDKNKFALYFTKSIHHTTTNVPSSLSSL
jgi:hypothetical protein